MSYGIETAVEILRVRTPAQYAAAARLHWAKTRVTEQPQADPLLAHINTGRWVTPCDCGSGVALHPDWQYAACFGCGRTWTSVLFPAPADLAAIDAVLAARPVRRTGAVKRPFYSWVPSDTIEKLAVENAQLHTLVHEQDASPFEERPAKAPAPTRGRR